jgi:hypothetical protein
MGQMAGRGLVMAPYIPGVPDTTEGDGGVVDDAQVGAREGRRIASRRVKLGELGEVLVGARVAESGVVGQGGVGVSRGVSRGVGGDGGEGGETGKGIIILVILDVGFTTVRV